MQADKKWGFIVNPVAGNGLAKTYLPLIEKHAKTRNLNYDIALTEYHNHAVELAHDFAVKGYKYIIAVGGDGTIHEAATGLLQHDHDAILGAIPAGSGNDIIPMLGFPHQFTDKDWDIFFNCNTVLSDVGVCNGHYFINGMGLGIDAQIAVSKTKAEEDISKKHTSYFSHIIKTIMTFKEEPFTLILGEEETNVNCLIYTIGNGRRFGGGYYLTPKAIANDSTFDICFADKLSILERILLLAKVPSGTHIKNKKVMYSQADRILLQFNTKVPYHLDGEIYYDEQFIVNILPQKLKLLYNPEGDHYFGSN